MLVLLTLSLEVPSRLRRSPSRLLHLNVSRERRNSSVKVRDAGQFGYCVPYQWKGHHYTLP